MSAAAAVSWELRFLGRHQSRQRCCQVNAGCCVGPPDETGRPADVEVAVVGNSWSVCGERRRGASVRRDETGNRTASRSLPTLLSWERLENQPERSRATSRSLTPSTRGNVRSHSSRSSSRVDGDVRPTGIRVRRSSNVRGRSPEGDPPPGPFGA